MPDRRQNRGAHPQDAKCFAPSALPVLRRATDELSWLLGRDYSPKAALALVGDRYALRARQRDAVARCAVGEPARANRKARQCTAPDLCGAGIAIDGYNVLLTVEAALSAAVVLLAHDGNLRDLAAMSSHYKRVSQTRPAITLIGQWLHSHGCSPVHWYLDRPVSNSGRLRDWLLEVAAERAWRWQVELVADPDRVLAVHDGLVATADGGILDRCGPWLDLARQVVEASVPSPWLVDLRTPGSDHPAPARPE